MADRETKKETTSTESQPDSGKKTKTETTETSRESDRGGSSAQPGSKNNPSGIGGNNESVSG